MIRSASVVQLREGEAFTSTNHGLRSDIMTVSGLGLVLVGGYINMVRSAAERGRGVHFDQPWLEI